MTRYGQKGGDGPTAGRKAETIVAKIGVFEYRKRVFFGQRYICVAQCAEWPTPVVTAWHTQAEAEQSSERARAVGCEFHAWAKAEIVK